ncbi:MAG: hypothetical protein H8Z69_05410 [Nanohaloarchaea archaeon]|nr:hypothetical protein [Candidatus Nanohaloarchaea archaeon]
MKIATADREKIIEAVSEQIEGGGFPLDVSKIAGKVDISKRNVRDHLKEIVRDGDLIEKKIGQKNFYFPPSYDQSKIEEFNQLQNEIENAVDQLRIRYAELRDPTLEEVAEEISRDPEDKTFRKLFHKIKEEKDVTEPREEVVKRVNGELSQIIRLAIEIDRGNMIEELPEEEKPDPEMISRSEKYAEENRELMDKIDYKEITEELETPKEFEATLPKELQNILGTRKMKIVASAEGGHRPKKNKEL